MDSTAEETTAAQRLAWAVMQFNKSFGLFNKDELQRHFTLCTRGEIGVLFIIRSGAKSEARTLKLEEGGKLMRVTSSEAPTMKVSEISKLLHVTSPTITQLLKGLEANGLVERHLDPNDRRSVRIALTARGEEVAQRAEKIFTDSFIGLAEFLGEEESNQLIELLSKAYRYFNERETNLYHSQWIGDEKA
ncbi:MAG TPA: MarR family transcriptional regulator [Ktedonobacteraceae bacterium]|nr:MarR family transcriptional regulator [Ktedonobacteraceae bacterium]